MASEYITSSSISSKYRLVIPQPWVLDDWSHDGCLGAMDSWSAPEVDNEGFRGMCRDHKSPVTPTPDQLLHSQNERGTLPMSCVDFASKVKLTMGWPEWVEYIFANDSYRPLLRHAGIYKAIRVSTKLEVVRDNYAMKYLMSHWCLATHTFAASWGSSPFFWMMSTSF